jgi:hypothetical protein
LKRSGSDIQSTVRDRNAQARPRAASQEHSITEYPGERHVSARLISLKVTQFIIPLVQLAKTVDQSGRLFWIADWPLERHGSVHGVNLNGFPEMVYVWQLL